MIKTLGSRFACTFAAVVLVATTSHTARPFAQRGIEPADSASQEPPAARMLDFSADDVGDFYYYGNTPVPLMRSRSQNVVRLRPGATSSPPLAGLASGSSASGEIVSRGRRYRIVTVPAPDSAAAAVRESLQNAGTAELRLRADVDFAAPVLFHPATGTRLLPTGEIVARLRAGTAQQDLTQAAASLGLTVVSAAIGRSDQFLLRLESPAGDPLERSRLLYQTGLVAWAEPDFIQELQRFDSPNDPRFGQQWHLSNTGQGAGTPGADVKAPGAWDVTRGNAAIVIAVIDDGVDRTHEDLAGNLYVNPLEIPANGVDDDANGYVDDVSGWDFLNDDNDPNPTDPIDAHGTSVAGVAAARGNNSLGVTGVCQLCRILPVKIASASFASNSVIGDAIGYAGGIADVLNNSWGGGAPSSAIGDAIDFANLNGRGAGRGSLVMFATGNSASGFATGTFSNLPAGTHRFRFEYSKNASLASGDDTAWIAWVLFPGGEFVDFEGGMPAGWSTGGNANWSIVSDPVHADEGSCFTTAARAGAIGNSQVSYIEVVKTISAGQLQYRRWVSSQAGGDGITVRIDEHNDGPANGPFDRNGNLVSGVPAVTTAVAFPASHAGSIAVGASSNRDCRSSYSQFGPQLAFVAPSNSGPLNLAIETTDRSGAPGYDVGNYTQAAGLSGFGGTSSASPLAAGVAGLVLSRNPELTRTQVLDIMQGSADQVGPEPYAGGRNDRYGFGRLNAHQALLDTPLPGDSLPNIHPQPRDQLVTVGQNAFFTVGLTGMPEPTCQWEVSTHGGGSWSPLSDTAPYSGVTTTVLTVSNATLDLSGRLFRCVATNALASFISNSASLTVMLDGGPPLSGAWDGSTQQALAFDFTVNGGSSINPLTWTSDFAACGPPITQTIADVIPIDVNSFTATAGTTCPATVINGTFSSRISASGTATVTFTAGGGCLCSGVATLWWTATAPATAPAFDVHPADQTAASGATARFAAAASGQPPPAMRWQVSTDEGASWADVLGVAANVGVGKATLTVTGVAPDQSGDLYRAVATNDSGSATSDPAMLTVSGVTSPPTIDDVANQSTAEDTVLGPLVFNVGDADTPLGDLTVSVGSSNLTVVPLSGLLVGGSGANRTLTITPGANQSGTSVITLVVNDGITSTHDQFMVAVTPVNDPPTVSDVTNQSTAEDTPVGPLSFTLADVDSAVGSLTLGATSSNQTLIPNGGILISLAGASRTVTITPAVNQFGSSTITLLAGDGVDTGSDTFVVTVTPVNDPPTVSDISNQSTAEDTPVGPLNFTLSDVESLAGSLTVGATSSNQTLIPNSGILISLAGASRTVTVTPAVNQFGSSTITLLAGDGVDTGTGTFVVTVTPENDAPTIAAIADQVMMQSTTLGPVAVTVADVDTAAGTLVVTAAATNTALVLPAGLIVGGSGANRMLTITPVAGQTGTTTITVTVTDGAATAATMFNVLVNAPGNTPPTIGDVGNQSTAEDTPLGPLAFTIGDATTPVGNLIVTAASSNEAVVPAAGLVLGGAGASRTIAVSPAANQSGTSTISLTVNDGMATATDTFVVMVTPVNDAPAIAAIADQVMTAGTTLGPLSLSVSDIDTDVEGVTVTAQAANDTLVPGAGLVIGGSGANRTLTITPAAGQTGTTAITVAVSDGAAADGSPHAGRLAQAATVFNLTVSPATGPPGPPQNFVATVAGSTLSMSWKPPITGAAPTEYVLQAALDPGFAALVYNQGTGSAALSLVVPNVPPGVFHLRLLARNSLGTSGPSNPQQIPAPPGAPVLAAIQVAVNPITLTWSPGGGSPPSSYLLLAGTSPGSADLGAFPMGGQTSITAVAPIGIRIYVKVVAVHPAGQAASNEVSFLLPEPSAPGAPTLNPATVAPNRNVTLTWLPPATGGTPTSYTVLARLSPGGPVVASLPGLTGTAFTVNAPPGVYFVSLVAMSGTLGGPESNRITVTVP